VNRQNVAEVGPADLKVTRPLSLAARRSDVQALARALLEALGLEGAVVLFEADADSALKAEAYFRRRWWSGTDDSFRDAVHACKFRAHQAPGRRAAVTEAWLEMVEHVGSAVWRQRLRRLTAGRSAAEIRYVRMAFAAAQQVWTRAARWDAALAPEPNPFALIARLFERSCWPVGWSEGSLYVCQFSPGVGRERRTVFPEFQLPAAKPDGAAIFLSGRFRDRFTKHVMGEIVDRGFAVVHGRVGEHTAPEQQLGARIMAAPVTVAALSRIDPDFGVPWWTYQELDFAQACGRATALLTGSRIAEFQPGLTPFTVSGDMIEDRFWQWLDDTV
jgi:hypothetical protein